MRGKHSAETWGHPQSVGDDTMCLFSSQELDHN